MELASPRLHMTGPRNSFLRFWQFRRPFTLCLASIRHSTTIYLEPGGFACIIRGSKSALEIEGFRDRLLAKNPDDRSQFSSSISWPRLLKREPRQYVSWTKSNL